jgi:tetratricopeptide (TPR) repeat protein
VVGRDADLARLDAALEQAVAGRAVLVVVEGDAGIGKTTLVDAWSQSVASRALVLRGRCDELGRDLPLQPVADAIADHLRAIGPDRAAALAEDEVTLLAPLLGPVAGASATVVADAEAARGRVFAALVAVLARAGSEAPVVLVVEDLHLAGTGTFAWLRFARRRCQGTMLVVTSRPGGAKGLDADEHIGLGPLDRESVAELVGPERADALLERSGGHPLLLAALAAAGDEAMPATVRDAVATRVDTLGDDVAATLRVAAALGSDCDLDLIAQVTGAPVVDVLADLEAAARAGLVVERGSGFAFRHELVREALHAATGLARRALVHQQAARVLAARPDPDHLAVAVHAREGGDAVLASSSFVAAAAAAAARFDVEAAEDHLAEAIALAPSPDAFVARARLRMSRMALEEAVADAEQAISMGGGAPAFEAAGWGAYYGRRYAEARAYADEAVTRATGEAVRISALALGGRVRHAAGDLAGAVEHLASVGDGPLPVRGVADVWLAQVRLHQGRPADALEALARPMVDPDSLAHPWAPLHLRFNRIVALGQLGRVSEALRAVDELDADVERKGAVGKRFVAPAANVGAWILRWSGRGEDADDRNRRAVEVSGGTARPSEAFAEGHYVGLLDLADGCMLRGDVDGAAALADRLAPVDEWTGTMSWHQRHRLGLLRARLAIEDGRPERALALATAVADDAAARGAGRYELLALAIAGLADPSIPVERLVPVVEGLGRCAALDGWPLVAALAQARRSDGMRAEAERRAAAVVSAAPHEAAARALADRVLRP